MINSTAVGGGVVILNRLFGVAVMKVFRFALYR